MKTDELEGVFEEVFVKPLKSGLSPLSEQANAPGGQPAFPAEGRRRVVIENISPAIDDGRHPIKRVIGEPVMVEADLFADGHVLLSAVVKHRHVDSTDWLESQMIRVTNDRWRAEFIVTAAGTWVYAIEAWVDRFKSWRDEFKKKLAAGQTVELELVAGRKLIEEAASRTEGAVNNRLNQWAREFTAKDGFPATGLAELAFDETLGNLAMRHSERAFATTSAELRVTVDPERARFSSWYEMFPRSFSPKAGNHGTFKDCEAQLARIARMGFDVLYLPPIHPIGQSFRKGKNNSPAGTPEDPGSPWAIGAAAGGHKAVHPQLGTLEDFRELTERARSLGIEIALDIAFQCSPDHPYLKDHPEWFRKRPDGLIAYAWRIRPRSIRIFIRLILSVTTGATCGRNSKASLNFGPTGASGFSGWTIPTPNLSFLGNGAWWP